MGIPKIPACRGTSLTFICTFRISDFKNFVDKTTSCRKPLFSSFENPLDTCGKAGVPPLQRGGMAWWQTYHLPL